ncbi:sigma-70 family RNA polymerase sigma factor [bacterium]|nr:sigma-70 family RNA polymerase sigma factor [bacterium]
MSDERERIWHESALRSAALSGDQVAWQTLFDGTYDSVYQKLHAKADPLTEEVIQETWIVAARRLVDFDPRRGRFEAWLVGISRRVLADHRRAAARRAGLPLDFDPPEQTDDDTSDYPSEEIHQAMARLPNQYAHALTLRYLQDGEVSQVARLLQVSYKGAESILSRAREAFRKAFRGGTNQ